MIPRSVRRSTATTPKQLASPAIEIELDENKQIADIVNEALAEISLNDASKQNALKEDELLYAIECAVSDYSLSIHQNNGLLDKLAASPDGFLHVSHLLKINPIQNMANTVAQLQSALKSDSSSSIIVSDSCFHIKPKELSGLTRLKETTIQDWDSRAIYIEGIPRLDIAFTHRRLASHLERVLRVKPEKVIIPTHNALVQSSKRRSALPSGGGDFRGFCFVVLNNDQDVSDILARWGRPTHSDSDTMETDAKDDDLIQRARVNGFLAISLEKFLDLQKQYLEYQTTVQELVETRSKKGFFTQPVKETTEVESPPVNAEPESTPKSKKIDAFPGGCVVWVRNLNQSTTKAAIKRYFQTLLDQLQEGSRLGVEFVDYEKGLDNCHIRFASSQLASLVLDHFKSNEVYQKTPSYFAPYHTNSTDSTDNPDAKPLVLTLLEGTREQLYWASLPAAARKGALKPGAGPVVTASSEGKKTRQLEELEESDLTADREREAKRRRVEEAEKVKKQATERGVRIGLDWVQNIDKKQKKPNKS